MTRSSPRRTGMEIRNVRRRSLQGLIALLATGTTLGVTTQAEAGLRAIAGVESAVPMGSTEDLGSPTLAGRLRVQYSVFDDDLAVGLVGGYERGRYVNNQSSTVETTATLSTTSLGLSAEYEFAPKD